MESDALEFFCKWATDYTENSRMMAGGLQGGHMESLRLDTLQVERKSWSLFTGEDPLSSHWS